MVLQRYYTTIAEMLHWLRKGIPLFLFKDNIKQTHRFRPLLSKNKKYYITTDYGQRRVKPVHCSQLIAHNSLPKKYYYIITLHFEDNRLRTTDNGGQSRLMAHGSRLKAQSSKLKAQSQKSWR